MKTKKDYQKAFKLVRKEINNWDPYCLISEGSPEDEFDNEVARIVSNLNKVNSEIELMHIVSKIFSDNFEAQYFKPDDCKEVSIKIIKAIKENNLI